MQRKILLILLLLLPICTQASSEYSISFEEFKKRLVDVFDERQFADLQRRLPRDCEIWGYDVGDFSADEEPDLALSVKIAGKREKEVQVYFFVDDGEGFLEAKSMPVKYYEIPIEVGFTIEKGICFMTRKERNHHWFILGYTFRNESFVLVDRFEVGRRALRTEGGDEVGHEIYNNYVTLSSTESFFNVTNGRNFLKALYYTFPVYRVERRLAPDFTVGIGDTSAKYFLSGNDYWRGPNDISFSAKFLFDDSALYCIAKVTDDTLVTSLSNATEGDYVGLWFDLLGLRMNPSGGNAPSFRFQPDSNVIFAAVSPGDFKKVRPRVNLTFRRDPSEKQKKGIERIGVIARRTAGGYELHIKFPFSVFDLDALPSSLGFSLVVNDLDRMEGKTRKSIASSQLREWDPSSFGVLRFFSSSEVYGDVKNFGIERVLTRMKEVGVRI